MSSAQTLSLVLLLKGVLMVKGGGGGGQCRMSILRNDNVACHCRIFSPIYHMSNLRKCRMSLSCINIRNTDEAVFMRATILPYAIILTKAHRDVVSIKVRGVLWPEYCL